MHSISYFWAMGEYRCGRESPVGAWPSSRPPIGAYAPGGNMQTFLASLNSSSVVVIVIGVFLCVVVLAWKYPQITIQFGKGRLIGFRR
jgi:hypothetical protein